MGVCSGSHWLKKADPDHLFPTSHSEMSRQYLELGHSETIYTMEISFDFLSVANLGKKSGEII